MKSEIASVLSLSITCSWILLSEKQRLSKPLCYLFQNRLVFNSEKPRSTRECSKTITLIACKLQVGECNYIVRLALDIDKPLAVCSTYFQ